MCSHHRLLFAVALLALCLGRASGFMPQGFAAGLPLRGARACSSAASPLRMAESESPAKVVVCTGPTCSKTGGKKALALFKEMAPAAGVEVETISCVSECAECGMGPNVEVRAKGDEGPFYPIKNRVKTAEDVAKILGVPVPKA